MQTILFKCLWCNHVWPVPDILADRPATCPQCSAASGPEGFPYLVPPNTEVGSID